MTLPWVRSKDERIRDLEQRLDDLRVHYVQRARELEIASARRQEAYERGRRDAELEQELSRMGR